MNKRILVVFCCLMAIIANSQEQLTLEKCIGIALKNNLRLKQSGIDMQRQEFVKKQAEWQNAPWIETNATQDYEFGLNIDPNTNVRSNEDFRSNDLYIRASLDILNLTKLKTHEKSKIDLHYLKAVYENERNQVLTLIIQNYTEVLFQKEYLEILRAQVEESSAQKRRLEEALEYGYIAKSELYDAEAALASDNKAYRLGLNNSRKTVLNLLNLMNYDIGVNDVVIDGLVEIDTTTKINRIMYLDRAHEINPLAVATDLQLAGAKKNIEIKRANGWPKLALRYQLESFYTRNISKRGEQDFTSFPDQIRNNQTQFIGFAMQFPLFNGFENKYDIQVAKLDHEAAQINGEIIKDNLRFEVEQTIQNIENAIDAYQTSLKVIDAATESYRTARLKYEQGKLNYYNFADSKKNLHTSQFDFLEAKYQIYFNREKLKLMVEN